MPWRYQKVVCLPFCMNIWVWGSCLRNGCRVCSHQTKNNNELMIQSDVSSYLSMIRRIFCVDMWPWIKPGFITTHQSQNGSHLSGLDSAKAVQSEQKRNNRLGRLFWDTHGILFIDYLEKGKTINTDYYCALLERLKDEIAKKRPHMKKKKILFHQDNAPCHKSMKTMVKFNELHFELLPHPPYSPDLAPSDYWLFSDLKKTLQGKRFQSNEEVIAETEAYFEAKN